MTCEELSSLVIQNRDSIAFLVGNGIHNYEQYEKHVSGKVDWKNLIIKVRDEFFPDKKECCSNSTLSLPRQFDSIVREKECENIERNLKEPTNYLSSLVESIKRSYIFEDFSYCDIPNSQQLGNIDNMSFLDKQYLKDERLHQIEEEIRTRTKRLLASIGISLNLNSFDVQPIVYHIVANKRTNDFVAKQIIKTILENYTLQDWIIPFLQVADAIQAPILTTNYDTSLSKLTHSSPRIAVGANNKTQEGFPFETYFAPSPIIHPWDSFAIWHIHGLYNYVNSIRIGHVDYENLQREIQARLNKTTNPLNDNHWDNNNSWLSVVFRKKLFIMGLGLEKDEEVLWWLLKERAKYGLKGWYVCRDMEEINDEKRNNLQDVGLNVIKVDNIDLHENVWKNLLSKLDAKGTDCCNNSNNNH